MVLRAMAGEYSGVGPKWASIADMDSYDAHTVFCDNSKPHGEIIGPYRAGARRIVNFLNAKQNDVILDAGCRTGNTTLEAFMQYPIRKVIATEANKERIAVAQYKFHQGSQPPMNDMSVHPAWDAFRAQSAQYKDRVEFIANDITKLDSVSEGSIDAAIAHLSIRVSDPVTAKQQFSTLHKLLKPGADVIWSTACGAFTDERLPAADHYFMQNDFLKQFVLELRRASPVGFEYSLPAPGTMTLDSVKEYTHAAGFETEQIGTFVHNSDADFQTLIAYHIPDIVKTALGGKLPPEEEQKVFHQALAETLKNHDALSDTEHKVNVVPIFRSTKK